MSADVEFWRRKSDGKMYEVRRFRFPREADARQVRVVGRKVWVKRDLHYLENFCEPVAAPQEKPE